MTPVLRIDEKGLVVVVEWRSCQSRTDENHDSLPLVLRNIKDFIRLPVSCNGLCDDIVCLCVISDLPEYLLVQDMLLTKAA